MPKNKAQQPPKLAKGSPSKFESGAELGPIEDRDEREDRLMRLRPDEKELAEESARLADFCQYFSDNRMDIPPQILDQISGLSRLTTADRIRALKDINRALMEYINGVSEDPQFRQ